MSLLISAFVLNRSDFCYKFCEGFAQITLFRITLVVSLFFCSVASLFILPFSLITYKMRDDVFAFWLKFSFWGIPVALMSAVVIYFSIGGESPFRGGGIMFSWLILYGLYILLSLSLIIYKQLSLKKK